MKFDKSGISGFKPFLFLIASITAKVFEVGSNGSPETSAQ
jgi:hypothetical protein